MNILVTGATGLIASQVISRLTLEGHNITCCVRNTSFAQQIFPDSKVIYCDFKQDTHSDIWLDRLKSIDIVINCAGILYHPNTEAMWNIHYHTPKALFDACQQTGISKIIQISALGIDSSSTEYAKSKLAADNYLQDLGVNAIILRPSLVYGQNCYGGTALFRGLAGLPGVLLTPGDGEQLFQPVHIEDLSKAISRLISHPNTDHQLLHAVSNQKISLGEILGITRSWLGILPARTFKIPLGIIRFFSLTGNLIPYSTINSTSFQMMEANNITSEEETQKFSRTIEFEPRSFSKGMFTTPASVQDRWHARLFFLKPLLRLSLAFIWLFTAACSLFFYPHDSSYELLANAGISSNWHPMLLYGASIINALIGTGLLFGYQLMKLCIFQLLFISVYTLIISLALPYLWLEPFAPVAKNIPLVVAILVLMALESDR